MSAPQTVCPIQAPSLRYFDAVQPVRFCSATRIRGRLFYQGHDGLQGTLLALQDANKVSVSEVNDAMTSLKAAMLDGSADRNQVITMLSSLLRGGGGEVCLLYNPLLQHAQMPVFKQHDVHLSF